MFEKTVLPWKNTNVSYYANPLLYFCFCKCINSLINMSKNRQKQQKSNHYSSVLNTKMEKKTFSFQSF